jgi:beta-N-acetylhexosaminidase
VAGLVVGGGAGEEQAVRGPAPETEEEPGPARRLSLRQQVGQVLISSFDKAAMPDYIRRRLRAGETAGVILFGRNGGPEAQWRSLTTALQRAARGAALVMVDQEGGEIRTVSSAGPAAPQPLQGDAAAVRREALAAGRQLRELGVNVNLAPVADVPRSGSVMASRAFPGDAGAVAAATRASVAGLDAARVAATVKHFPGLGGATVNTDDASVSVDFRRSDLEPFGAAVAARVPLVMLSHALYPSLDDRRIASQSPVVADGLLRGELGFRGVIVTDSMEAQAVLDRSGVAEAAERSLRVGADLIVLTGSASWNEVFPRLLRAARTSAAFRHRIEQSAARVLALKRRLGLRTRG